MRALGTAMALSCAVVLGPSYAYADAFDAHAGKAACDIYADGASREGDRSARLSVAALSSEEHASINEHSPEVADLQDRHGSDDDDATFDERGGLENSAHFANQGSAQVFPDDRTSFGDEVSVEGFGLELSRQTTMALRKHERKLEKELAKRGGGVLVPQAAGDPTPNPEPASMLLIGTGLAGLFRYRRQLFS